LLSVLTDQLPPVLTDGTGKWHHTQNPHKLRSAGRLGLKPGKVFAPFIRQLKQTAIDLVTRFIIKAFWVELTDLKPVTQQAKLYQWVRIITAHRQWKPDSLKGTHTITKYSEQEVKSP
jgi:hypothetical protein